MDAQLDPEIQQYWCTLWCPQVSAVDDEGSALVDALRRSLPGCHLQGFMDYPRFPQGRKTPLRHPPMFLRHRAPLHGSP